jgi:3',5'-cyclic-AMP phosphodiesterase
MPISVARRDFLKWSLALGAAAGLPRLAKGTIVAPDPPLYDHLALLSDIHVSGGLMSDMAKRFSTTLTQVLAKNMQKVLVCGDCAYLTGNNEDYREYVRRMQPLLEAGLPLHMTLGNHDDRDRFWNALPREQPDAKVAIKRQSMVVEGAQANWFLLDSLNEDNKGFGELGADQLAWLSAKLDVLAGKPALLMVHHDLVRDGKPGALKDAEKLLAIARPRRQVKAIFFGHTHVWSATQDRSGIHLVNLPATGFTLWGKSFLAWLDCWVASDNATLTIRALEPANKYDGQTVLLKWRPGTPPQ